VKTVHHRARRAMAAYDRTRRPPTRDLCAATRQVLHDLVGAVITGDAARMEALLADDVRSVSDGAGEFHAARVPVVGKARVARFFLGLAKRRTAGSFRIEVRMLNGLPALVADFGPGRPGDPPRGIIRADLGPDGRVHAIHAVLATRKLTAVRFA
jgi:RNA polymerase sigma-70 factor (ECF subfamily)